MPLIYMYISFLPTEYIKSRIDSQQRISDLLFSFPTKLLQTVFTWQPKDKLRVGETKPASPVNVSPNVHQIHIGCSHSQIIQRLEYNCRDLDFL